jgi:UDP-glucose 4-epimerase
MPRRVVVFGGTGFIGQHVVRACLAVGLHVTVVVRPGGSVDSLAALLPDIAITSGDFTVQTDVERALSDADAAIALVGSTVPATAVRDPSHELFATILPYVHFLDVAARAGVGRVIVTSSGGTVYGRAQTLPIPEDHPLLPIVPYGIAKAAIERYCAFYRDQFGLDTCVLRVANPYGPGQRVESGQGFIGTVYARLLLNRPVALFGDGRAVRDFVYVEDVADAFVRALRYTGPARVFNVGSGEGTELRDLLTAIEGVTGRTIPTTRAPARSFDVAANVLDISCARHQLGWQPVVPLRTGLARTWDAFRAHPHPLTMLPDTDT